MRSAAVATITNVQRLSRPPRAVSGPGGGGVRSRESLKPVGGRGGGGRERRAERPARVQKRCEGGFKRVPRRRRRRRAGAACACAPPTAIFDFFVLAPRRRSSVPATPAAAAVRFVCSHVCGRTRREKCMEKPCAHHNRGELGDKKYIE